MTDIDFDIHIYELFRVPEETTDNLDSPVALATQDLKDPLALLDMQENQERLVPPELPETTQTMAPRDGPDLKDPLVLPDPRDHPVRQVAMETVATTVLLAHKDLLETWEALVLQAMLDPMVPLEALERTLNTAHALAVAASPRIKDSLEKYHALYDFSTKILTPF